MHPTVYASARERLPFRVIEGLVGVSAQGGIGRRPDAATSANPT